MNRVILGIVLVLLSSTILKAAEFTEGCFGFRASYLKPELNILNGYVNEFLEKDIENNILLYSGDFIGKVKPNIEMGIFYSTASTQTTRIVYVKDETTSKYNELTRKVEFGFSYLGLSLNLVKKSFIEFYSGASASIGKTYIITSQDDGDMRFNDLWDLSNEHKRTFNYSAWSYFFEGYSGFRYYLAKGVAIDVRASYLDVIVSKEGEINNGFETVSNVPSLDFKSIVYSLSIYFGN